MADDHTERLVLADPATVKAVVAWSAVPKRTTSSPTELLVEWAPGVWYDPELWMVAAGMSRGDHGRVASKCRTLEFIDAAGEVWPPIIVYARALAAKSIKEKTRAKT